MLLKHHSRYSVALNTMKACWVIFHDFSLISYPIGDATLEWPIMYV